MRLDGYYFIKGKSRDGDDVCIGKAVFDGGYPYFTARLWEADLLTTATAARAVLRVARSSMGSCHNAERMDLASFEAYEATVELKPVEVDDAVRERLQSDKAEAPGGWLFVIADTQGRTFATPKRHWTSSSSAPTEAAMFQELSKAVSALDTLDKEGFAVYVARWDMCPAPLPDAELDARVREEYAEKRAPEDVEDLSEIDVYKPF